MGRMRLGAVRQYPHLGTILDERGTLGPEVAHRIAGTTSSAKVLSRKVFKAVPKSPEALGMKMRFVDSLLSSSLLFNAGTWSNVERGAYERLRHTMLRRYRAACGMFQCDDSAAADRTVLAEVQRADLSDQMRVHRLRLLGRVLHFGSDTVKGLLTTAYRAYSGQKGKTSWLHHVTDDLVWLRGVCRQVSDLPDPRDDFSPWERKVQASCLLGSAYSRRQLQDPHERTRMPPSQTRLKGSFSR